MDTRGHITQMGQNHKSVDISGCNSALEHWIQFKFSGWLPCASGRRLTALVGTYANTFQSFTQIQKWKFAILRCLINFQQKVLKTVVNNDIFQFTDSMQLALRRCVEARCPDVKCLSTLSVLCLVIALSDCIMLQ